MKFLTCQNCNKKLLKIGTFYSLSIKCPRCKTLNHLSVMNAAILGKTLEVHETHLTNGDPRGHTQNLQQSPTAIHRAET